MNKLKYLSVLLLCSSSSICVYAKQNTSWNDLDQDSIQVKDPLWTIREYNKYTVINPNLKIKLVDYGNKNEVDNRTKIQYVVKKYGVEVLNGNKVFSVFQTSVPLKSSDNVRFTLLYNDKDFVAFSVKEFNKIDYIKRPYDNYRVNTYFYNVKKINICILIL